MSKLQEKAENFAQSLWGDCFDATPEHIEKAVVFGYELCQQEYEEKLRWIPVEEFDFKIKESNEPDIVICKEDNRYSVIEITDLYSVNYVKNNSSHCRYFL